MKLNINVQIITQKSMELMMKFIGCAEIYHNML